MQETTVGKTNINDADWQCFLYGTTAKLFRNTDDGEATPRKGSICFNSIQLSIMICRIFYRILSS